MVVSKSTWYTHNPETRRRNLASARNLVRTRAQEGRSNATPTPLKGVDVKEGLDVSDDLEHMARSDSVCAAICQNKNFAPRPLIRLLVGR